MKRCTRCNDFALYDDETSRCPLCGEVLVRHVSKRANQERGVEPTWSNNTYSGNRNVVRPNRSSDEHNTNGQRREAPVFKRRQGLNYVYQGIITEITPLTRYNGHLKKIFNAIFRDEPYQFSHSTHMVAFRIEEFSDNRVAVQKQNCIFYGDVEGMFNVGDEATVTVKRKGTRHIVKNLFLNETGVPVRAGLQMPAWIIKLIFLIILIFVISLVTGIADLLASGVLQALLKELFTTVVAGLIIIWMFKELIRRR